MLVIDEATGKTVWLHSTEELVRDLGDWEAAVCSHLNEQVVLATYSNQAKHYVRQCLRCGQRLGGGPIAKANAPNNAPEEDLALRKAHEENRRNQRQNILFKHLQIQKRRETASNAQYTEYLSSPEWAAKRAKVMKRDNNLCQGCMERPATHVHHRTYDHIFDELLFELVSLCDECHKKCHPELDAQEFVPFADQSPCDGCRWQSENDSGREICALSDVPASKARADASLCGPNRNGYEPMK